MPSAWVFDRWTILNGALNADDAEKFETGRTLEEFAFTMPAEPLSIEATPRMQEEEGSRYRLGHRQASHWALPPPLW